MLSQIKKDKLGVSIMVGYVLLVSLAIVMGGMLYTWMKSYLPEEPLECPEGVSIFVNDYYYNCTNSTLNLTLKNNGRFNIAGYFIHATNNSNQTVATIDLSAPGVFIKKGSGLLFGNKILFEGTNNNSFKPNQEIENIFDLASINGQIHLIEIIPVRWQREKNKLDLVSCGNEEFREILTCNG